MKKLWLVGFAATAMLVLPAVSASALPIAAPNALISIDDGAVIAVKGGHGHGRGHMGRGGRGHHYGWARGRGHHYGWSRGRHRGWR